MFVESHAGWPGLYANSTFDQGDLWMTSERQSHIALMEII